MLEKNPYKIVVHLPKSAEADQIQTFAYMVTRRESSYGRCKPPKKSAYLRISIVQVDDEMRGFHSRYTGRAIHPHWSYLHHRLNHILPYKRIYADNFCLKICQIAIKELGFFSNFTWQGKCSATHFVKRLTVCLNVGASLPIWAWPLSCPTGRNLSFLCSTKLILACLPWDNFVT